MLNSYRVAAVQMVSGADVAANLAEADQRVAEAAAQGATLIALPEYFACLSPDENAKVRMREKDGSGPLQDFLADCARRHAVWLVGGTIPLVADDDNRVRNTSLVYDDRGARVARYDKLHLFAFQRGAERYDEARTIEAGIEVKSFDSPCGPTGLAVCYDLRFPEMFRQMGKVNLIVLPAAFTATTGQAHWEVLLRARAIENQCYVLASAQGGVHPHGRQTFGHSMLVDPWGVVVASLPTGGGVVIGEVNAERITSVRESLPALDHRKLM
ncbi:MAG TPA: carbon-nitrogen hydrolase family protein [Rhodocyclaceae bacterium]|nr:carbon-nitrogen hydrolase family protein [Rhodocyclaceae bacterium]